MKSRKLSVLLVLMVLLSIALPVFAVESSSLNVKPTVSKVLVNGEELVFDAYNINGNNYFKLRDLAKVVSGTEKQFEVKWDNEKSAINLVSNESYTEVGGELAVGDGSAKIATLTTSIVYKDGEEVKLQAYNIGYNNYFKLRDIGQAFNIGITYDGETNTVGIDTTTGYVAEEAQVEKTEATETEVTEEAELWIKSMDFVEGTKILVVFEQPIPASKAGETYAALYYEDYVKAESWSPGWESGMELNLVEGTVEMLIDMVELPGPGRYAFDIHGFKVRESNLISK